MSKYDIKRAVQSQRRMKDRRITEERKMARQRKHFESNYEWTVAR